MRDKTFYLLLLAILAVGLLTFATIRKPLFEPCPSLPEPAPTVIYVYLMEASPCPNSDLLDLLYDFSLFEDEM